MAQAGASSEERELRSVLRHLEHDFPDVPVEVLDAEVHLTLLRFDHATVREYLPLLVERDVRSRLRAG